MPEDHLLALENMHPVLETQARAARAAGELETAERYYRALVAHDPQDAKTHVRFGDYLLSVGSPEQARRHFQEAAVLGAPYTAYAHTQGARCSLRLGDDEQGIASLVQAARSDPYAITPLLLLRDLLPGTTVAALRPWVEERLRTLSNALRKGKQ
jgi:Tfp pilus assembly protein PilF